MTTDQHGLVSAVPSFVVAWKQLIIDVRVPDGAVRLYLLLGTYCRSGRMNAFPGQERLARELNCSVETIKRHGKALRDTGWIVVKRRGNGRTNVYYLQMPQAVNIPVDDPWDDEPEVSNMTPLEVSDLRLPNEVNEVEVVTPPTTLPGGSGRRSSTRSNTAPLTDAERAADFQTWWTAYPRKVGKIKAEQAWRQMLPRMQGVSVDTMVRAVEALARRTAREHPESNAWERYMPHPTTWLHRGDFLVDDERPVRPPDRNPCALCGMRNPNAEGCHGLIRGLIDELEACPWA